ncbi:TraR/DksA family transcriptional regulator [Moraxella bovis]|uniref:TraR/DksA family transcriptional regulator n=1 Tax=Moraxella bovis TaxID=476 RepID=UPI0009941A38|nr:TraR/DksA family transcriptional regulator [Moraxella bovis]OOR91164.1 conjugal transfer protein TraR [Moraxella bovis]UZA18095.1 TraR/DksA family transcriptional regulator [Moraxella bovis]
MTDINKHKADLLALKAEYEYRIDKITNHLEHPQDELGQHWDDQAVAAQENDMRKNLLIEAQENLAKANVALSCIENDLYGECSECGEEIEEGRLDAVPYATECIKHAK